MSALKITITDQIWCFHGTVFRCDAL